MINVILVLPFRLILNVKIVNVCIINILKIKFFFLYIYIPLVAIKLLSIINKSLDKYLIID